MHTVIEAGLRTIAEEGLSVRVKGTCMAPCLDDGASVCVVGGGSLLPGDILAYRADDGRLVLHRLLGWYRRGGGWKLLLQADSARRPDRGIRPQQVLGKVVDVDIPFGHRAWAVGRYGWFAAATMMRRVRRQVVDRRRAA